MCHTLSVPGQPSSAPHAPRIHPAPLPHDSPTTLWFSGSELSLMCHVVVHATASHVATLEKEIGLWEVNSLSKVLVSQSPASSNSHVCKLFVGVEFEKTSIVPIDRPKYLLNILGMCSLHIIDGNWTVLLVVSEFNDDDILGVISVFFSPYTMFLICFLKNKGATDFLQTWHPWYFSLIQSHSINTNMFYHDLHVLSLLMERRTVNSHFL